MSYVTAIIIVCATAATLGGAVGYFIVRLSVRAAAPQPLDQTSIYGTSPDCDRCGKDTKRPHLRLAFNSRQLCADCESWLDNQLFPDTDSADYDQEQHTAFLRAYVELKQKPTA